MEINGNNPLIGLKNNVQQLDGTQKYERADMSGNNPGSRSDSLELSIKSREAAHLDDLIRSAPDVRQARVEQITRDLHNGTYNVKAEKIAEKIIGGNLLDKVF